MQSYCIYAEAFAGPFWLLRAPEPPFTHKTPPFTQVLFLFDAFYGTISLRKPSSLCSYKTESEVSMKKRILALLLAFSMMLSLLPVSALADTGGGIGSAVYASNEPLPDLVMGSNGMPDLSGITPVSPGVYQGNGWKYEIIDSNHTTLTLESRSYNFNNTKPTTEDGETLNLVTCKVVVKNGATITGGRFHAMLNYGTVENSLLSTDDIKNLGGTMTNCLFNRTTPPEGVANYHKLTEVNGAVFNVTLPNVPKAFSNCQTYYFTGTPTLVVCLAVYGGFNKLNYINGEEYYGSKTGPDSYGYYTFTPKAGEDVVLNQEPYVTDLAISNGMPDLSRANQTSEFVFQGNGWKYEIDSHTLTLERGEYNFSKNGLGQLDPDVKLVVGAGAKLTGGAFNEIPHGLTADNVQPIILNGSGLNGSGSIEAVNGLSSPKWNTTLYAIKNSQVEIKADTDITNINGWDIGKFPGGSSYPNGEDDKTTVSFRMPDGPVVLNDTIIHEPFTMTNGYPTASNGGKTACKGEGWEYILGDPEHGDFLFLSNAQIDFSKISDGSPVECKLFIGHGVAVQGGTFNGKVINNGGGILGGTFNGDVINNGGILGGTFNGAVENHGTIENGVFNGAVTNIDPGTVSNSITGTGTLNGKPITPNAYTLTVTGGGLVNGKTSAVVKADEEVRLTVGEGQDGMSFNYWDLPTPLLKALTDSSSGGFSNKVESLTFTMPDLSEYTEDKSFTIRLDIRPAELPDDDDGPSVLGTMATVAVGGAAAGILVWQGVSLGVDSYLQLSLPGGVPVPTNRRELVKLLWETAGKPDVVLPALYGDVSAEDGELQKATRWAIDNGLVKPADETDASRFDPDRSVSKYEVARAWFKVQQMLK